MGGPSGSSCSSSARRSFPRPWPGPHLTSPRPRLASARSFSPRRGQRRKRGRASAPSGQWGPSLEAGAWQPRRDASSGGCFKMAGEAAPSLPGSAFWSCDCILCPAARGRRALLGGKGGGARRSVGQRSAARTSGQAWAFPHQAGCRARPSPGDEVLLGGNSGSWEMRPPWLWVLQGWPVTAEPQPTMEGLPSIPFRRSLAD